MSTVVEKINMQTRYRGTTDIDPVSVGFKVDQDGLIFYKNSLLYFPPKERGVFRLLLQAWPGTVSKEDFAHGVWAGHMSDESLARCITQLRRMLSHLGTIQIDSLYGRGYRAIILPDQANPPKISPPSVHSRMLETARIQPALAEACNYAQQLLAHCSLETLTQAESILIKVISQAPGYMAAKLTLAQCMADKINYGVEVEQSLIDDGLALLESMHLAAPQTPGLQSQIAHLLDSKWHFDVARLRHQQALRMSSNDALTYFHYGQHLLAINAPLEAVDAFDTARELNPFSPNISVMLARASSLASGDPVSAVAQARSTYTSHPESPQAYMYLLSTLALMDPQPETAYAARQLAVTRSSWAGASGMISYALARCGDRTGALEIIAAQSKENAGTRVMHGAALIALGLVDEAMARVKEAASLGCGSLPILLNALEYAPLKQHPEYPSVHEKVFFYLPKKQKQKQKLN
ncbi:hypothetical protein LT85_2524 [Collimonas arenae]|uniref:OmpR/PhoB-type domain-containing protein n=1 Tax=Collimonas arenae TaxID=279058 RepID=A0A0A1FFR4_9BURK|nr:winged helix-turn-helix domain-containing protein [Collimonas arenae]AIY41682.1 hypothetical protein LT85_2524 [Collimonas arenae]